jgi:CheY-like chemotaxis protein
MDGEMTIRSVPPPHFGARLSVLIADGDEDFRRLVRQHLGRAVRVVGETCDGEEAVWLAKWLHPDVVLMALAMPNVPGPEAARRIKADRAETKVVLLTSSEQERQLDPTQSPAAAALRFGVDALIPKRNVRPGAAGQAGRRRFRRGRR